MMGTPVRNEREKSSSLRLLQESIRRSHEEVPSSLNTPLLELTRRGEEKTSNTTSEEAVSSSALHLEHVLSIVESKFPDLVFALGVTTNDHKPVLLVTQRDVSYHPPFGYTSQVCVTIQQDCIYQVHILMQRLESGTVSNEGDVCCLLEKFSSASLCKFCPGIEWKLYQEHYFEVIRFDIKSVRRTESPFYQVDSVNCKLWFRLPANAKFEERACAEVLCLPCKQLISDLNWQLKSTQSESSSRNIKRPAPLSRARLT